MDGYRFNDECLSKRDVASPKPIPRAVATLKESKNMPMPWKIEDRNISVPWNLVSVLRGSDQTSHNHSPSRWGHSLIHDDTHSIVQQTLTKDNAVQFWVDLILLKNSQNGNRVSSGQRGSECETFE